MGILCDHVRFFPIYLYLYLTGLPYLDIFLQLNTHKINQYVIEHYDPTHVFNIYNYYFYINT
jgi:hypothetical protein